MRKEKRDMRYALGMLTGTLGLLGIGCWNRADDCALNAVPCGTSTTTSSSTSGTGGTGTGGTGGTGGTVPAGCIPSDNVDAVGDTCGVFVSDSLGKDTNNGNSKGAPFKTLGAALAQAKGRPIYACGEAFAESVSITTDATLYGGLDCANGWVYTAAKKTQVNGGADAIAVTISEATTSVEVFDFAIASANATKDGGSSIAVLVAQAAVSFTRCDVTAGDGKAGLVGEKYTSDAQAGSDGNTGKDACVADMSFGGKAVTNACGSPDSVSGAGGIGDAAAGGDGSNGSPLGPTNRGTGDMGAGCTAGTQGDDGDTFGLATPGLGASALGTLSASGYSGASGGEGLPGKPGQGGGGGGGAKGGTGGGKCADPMSAGGASGGSGGSGGCGGLGGKGGAFGGASLALVSIDATLTFASVTLKAGNGGNGGDGGGGQLGGSGGGIGPAGKAKPMYANLNDACTGGPGGKGGSGGKGGGGTGGHAITIAKTGKAVPMMGWTATKGTAGTGGKGDIANGNMGDGANGLAEDCWDFSANAACK